MTAYNCRTHDIEEPPVPHPLECGEYLGGYLHLREAPERLPVADVSMGGLVVRLRRRERVVLDDQHAPDDTRDEATGQSSHEGGTTRPRQSGDDRYERGHNDVAVADVEQDVVVELGGREDRAGRVDAALPLTVGHHHSHEGSEDQHDDVPGRGVVPTQFGRKLPRHHQQSCRRHPEKDIPREERQELPTRTQRNHAALTDQSDGDHADGRHQPADHQRQEEVASARHPTEAGQQTDFARSIHCAPRFG